MCHLECLQIIKTDLRSGRRTHRQNYSQRFRKLQVKSPLFILCFIQIQIVNMRYKRNYKNKAFTVLILTVKSQRVWKKLKVSLPVEKKLCTSTAQCLPLFYPTVCLHVFCDVFEFWLALL